MTTAAPFVKLLRQLSGAKDEYRSGAMDIAWEGGSASIYMVFGQPNHATFASEDGVALEGQEAIAALVTRLPNTFTIGPWRKVITRTETLKCSVDELMAPIAQLAGANSPESADERPSLVLASDLDEVGSEVGFGLDDFPLLPYGESMWSQAAAGVVHLDMLIPTLPTSLLVLTGAKLRAAAIVAHGQIIDAVWVDESEAFAGESAAMAVIGTPEGTISGYRLEDARVAEALTMLWRCPVAYSGIDLDWLDPEKFLRNLERKRRDCVIKVEGSNRAVACFVAGELVMTYSDSDRQPDRSVERLLVLLGATTGTLTILQRSDDIRIGEVVSEASFHAYVPGGEIELDGNRPSAAAAIDPLADTEVLADWYSPVPEAGAPAFGYLATPATELDSVEVAVDFERVKSDLIQIGVLWLGRDDIEPIAAIIQKTQPSVDAFVATIDTIKAFSLERHDVSVIRAMAREMQFHAAEVLCGA